GHREDRRLGRGLQLRAQRRADLGRGIAPPVTLTLEATEATARAGSLHTPHGDIPTPVFMPVGTYGAVRTVSPDELTALGAGIILRSTLPLLLLPGPELIERMVCLHGLLR